jgi:hypothetical protein
MDAGTTLKKKNVTIVQLICILGLSCFLCFVLFRVGLDGGKHWESDVPPDPNHVRATDEIRKQYGIIPILPDFEFNRRIGWKDQSGKSWAQMDWWEPKRRISKSVIYDAGFKDIIWEQNVFYSGRKFPAEDGDGSDFESMNIDFNYVTHHIDVYIHSDDMSQYSFSLPDQSHWDPSSKGNPDLERARLVLQIWGIKRL